ncbi:DUF397 domain-containing protein [Streptomyces prasinus]
MQHTVPGGRTGYAHRNRRVTSFISRPRNCEVPMTAPTQWRESSYSGGGEGNDCVEIADLGGPVAIRGSKRLSRASFSVLIPVFAPFAGALKEGRGRSA